MRTLWAQGYAATSLDDLCRAMAISRSSFYQAFGSKRKMLLAALEFYEKRAVDRILAELNAPGSLREAVARIFDGFFVDVEDEEVRRGCFIGNCAAEFAPHDRLAAERVRESYTKIEACFRERLTEARRRGEIAADCDPTATARFLTSSIQGLRLVAKTGPDASVLRDIAAMTLRCLH